MGVSHQTSRMDSDLSSAGNGHPREESGKPPIETGAAGILPGDADLLPEALPGDNPLVASQPDPDGSGGERRPISVARPLASDTRRVRLNPALNRRIRGLLHLALFFVDTAMLSLGFLLGYIARARLPLPALPVNPPSFTSYVPMLVVHLMGVLTVFYFARMYHQRRAVSRFDEGYSIAQNVSIGTFLAVAFETLAFKNSAFELDYPRGVIIYAWFFGIILTVIGRELHRQTTIRLRRRGVGSG